MSPKVGTGVVDPLSQSRRPSDTRATFHGAQLVPNLWLLLTSKVSPHARRTQGGAVHAVQLAQLFSQRYSKDTLIGVDQRSTHP